MNRNQVHAMVNKYGRQKLIDAANDPVHSAMRRKNDFRKIVEAGKYLIRPPVHPMRSLFIDMNHDDLVDTACHLYDDCERLRRELDDERGVIR